MADDEVLETVLAHAGDWRASVALRPIGPQASIDDLLATFGGPCRIRASSTSP